MQFRSRLVTALTAVSGAVAALTLGFAAPAFAGSPHFVGTPVYTVSGSTVTVSAKEAGLGDESQIVAELTATATCVNRGGNNPQAANKTTVTAQSLEPVQNGKADYSLSGTAVFDPSSPCPDPMDVTWSGITLTDATNNLTVTPVAAP